jgi:hypothetical protein
LKRKAHQLGVVRRTGIRNEFAESDKTKRAAEIISVKNGLR